VDRKTKAPPPAAGAPAITSERELVVFFVRRTARCVECDAEIGPGELLRLEDKRPLCLTCADLDQLV